jgi:DtxR family transcriptional regulator, Mn-dependent transcriptional regulator
MLSFTEENYLKALLRLTVDNADKSDAGTNELASFLKVKPATATDMLKKLKEKKLVEYEKYGKISLTGLGKGEAIEIVRRHRLWETFLHDKLEFSWDEVHDIAEQLEHIRSTKLIDKLDQFLDYPEFDPHGDAIPNANGEMPRPFTKTLSEAIPEAVCTIIAVRDNSPSFLQYVTKLGLKINTEIKVLEKQEFDQSMELEVKDQRITVSKKFAENIFIG